MNLSTPIKEVSRVGPQYQKKLRKLGIQTVRDLLWHFPHRYEDFSNIIPISEARIGESVCVQGEILEIENTRTWKKRMFLTTALIKDNYLWQRWNGAIKLYNNSNALIINYWTIPPYGIRDHQ